MPDAFPRLSQRTVLRALRTQLRAVLVAAAIASIVSAAPAVATSRVFRVYIENNLPEPVIVRDCDSYCSSAPIDLYLAPGVKAPINRITNDHKFFSVTSDGGQHLGCLDLFFTTPAPGTEVPVTGTVDCTGSNIPWALIGALGALLLVGGFIVMRPRLAR